MKSRFIIILINILASVYGVDLITVIVLFIYALTILRSDIPNFKVRRIDISTAFASLLIVSSLSHFMALTSGAQIVSNYLPRYGRPEFLSEALAIYSIGSIVIMESLRLAIKKRESFNIVTTPKNDSFFFLVYLIVFLIFISIKVYNLGILPGTIKSFISQLINGGIFYLSVLAHKVNSRKRIILTLIFTTFLSLYSLQYSYLRMEIIIPWLAYFTGELLVRRSFLKLTNLSKMILFFGVIIFPSLFIYLGRNRSELSGKQDKLAIILNEAPNIELQEQDRSILGRLSFLGQLTAVVELVRRNGFYNGRSLDYFAFVFIPRFIWPDKPLIDSGQWFALEIGHAIRKENGKANTSINMTVPGELYLNYSWIGVIIGSYLFGFFLGKLWNTINGWDLVSWSFKFYLIFLGLFSLGADLMILPQLVSYFILYKAWKYFEKRWNYENSLYRPRMAR